jgi:hypothetical protein
MHLTVNSPSPPQHLLLIMSLRRLLLRTLRYCRTLLLYCWYYCHMLAPPVLRCEEGREAGFVQQRPITIHREALDAEQDDPEFAVLGF